MKQLIFLLVFCTIYCSSKSQYIKKIIVGTWLTKQFVAREYSKTDEEWTFKESKTGVWQRFLDVSNNAITCTLANPFKWTLLPNKKLKITLGKTTCNCKASEKKFETGLTEFVDNLKAVYEGEFFEYKVTVENASVIYFDKLKLDKKN